MEKQNKEDLYEYPIVKAVPAVLILIGSPSSAFKRLRICLPGLAALVPPNLRQPATPFRTRRSLPLSCMANVTTSGFMRP